MRVLSSNDLRTDEAVLTGEPLEVLKTVYNPATEEEDGASPPEVASAASDEAAAAAEEDAPDRKSVV